MQPDIPGVEIVVMEVVNQISFTVTYLLIIDEIGVIRVVELVIFNFS